MLSHHNALKAHVHAAIMRQRVQSRIELGLAILSDTGTGSFNPVQEMHLGTVPERAILLGPLLRLWRQSWSSWLHQYRWSHPDLRSRYRTVCFSRASAGYQWGAHSIASQRQALRAVAPRCIASQRTGRRAEGGAALCGNPCWRILLLGLHRYHSNVMYVDSNFLQCM